MDLVFQTHARRHFEHHAPPSRDAQSGSVSERAVEIGKFGWKEIENTRCIVLLGEPNIGKTREFQHQSDRLQEEKGVRSVVTRLRKWLAGEDILAVEHELRAALDSGENFHWFVDSLDEGRLKWEDVFTGLMKLLRQLSTPQLERMSLRLSCRAREWKESEQEHLEGLFADPNHEHAGLVVVRMLPIDETSARALIKEKLKTPILVERFIHTCKSNDVMGLAGFPLLLATMLEQFKNTNALAENRTGLFRQAFANLLDERNKLHRQEGEKLASLAERQKMADALAAQCVLTGTLIFSEDQAFEMVSDASGGSSLANAGVLRQVLNSGLFTPNGETEYQFVHRSFADFGAARMLSDALASRPLRSVLPAFSLAAEGIPEPMRDTAAFLAGMNAAFREWLIETDYMVACNGDAMSYPAQTRARLIKLLEDRFTGLSYQGQFTRYGDLAYQMPVAEAQRLLGKSNSPAVRALALGLISSCPSSAPLDPVLDLANDATEIPDFRVYAVNLLCSVNAKKFADQLTHGAASRLINDPDDEVAGALLSGLYPKHMSLDVALTLLHAPQSINRGKTYKDFWSKTFWSQPLDADERRRAIQGFADVFQHFDMLAATKPEGRRKMFLSGLVRGTRDVFEKFCEEVKVEVISPARDVKIVGPWLLAASNWSRRHLSSLSPQPLSALLLAGDLRDEVLRWAVTAAPTNRDLRPSSDIPFFRETYHFGDLGLLLAFIREHVDEPRISAPLFTAVLGMFMSTASVEDEQDMRLVAALSPELAEAAQQFDDNWKQSEEDTDRHFEMMADESDVFNESPHRPLDTVEIAAVESGNVDPVLAQLAMAKPNLDIASAALVHELKTLPPATQEAARKGALVAWEGFNDASALWPSNPVQEFGVPPGVRSAVTGFWMFAETLDNEDDLLLRPAQAELLMWMARESEQGFESLLGVVWDLSNAVAQARLQAILETEDQQARSGDKTMWLRLRNRVNLQPELIEFVKAFAGSHLQAKNAKTRSLVYSFLRRYASAAELRSMVAPLVSIGRSGLGDHLDGPAEEPALVSLAMAWLIDRESVHSFGPTVFAGPNHLRRADEFTGAISSINQPGHVAVGWAETVDLESLGVLVPYLFFKDEEAQAGTISPISLHARDHVFRRMLGNMDNAPQVHAFFAKWKDDKRFVEKHRSYLTDEHAKLRRHLSLKASRAMSRAEATALLRRRGNVVRGTRDVINFLDELIETKLVPSFRTDHSLTPMLWGKNGKDHHPRDEKDVQTAVYALLRMHVQLANVVGAREPEQSDGKKPDIRFDFTDEVNVSVPIEIKWSHHKDVWHAMDTQLLQLYMKDADVTYGVYLVAWSGKPYSGEDFPKPTTAAEMLTELRKITDKVSEATGKTISVFMIDATLSPEMEERRRVMEEALKALEAASKAAP